MNGSENIFKSYASSPASLISFMENSRDNWFIKDQDSRYHYMNKAARFNFNVPEQFDIEGKLDKEIPLQSSQDLWPELIKHDQKVMNTNKEMASIEIHFYGKNNNDDLVPHICDKSPLYDNENKIIGIVCHGKLIDAPTLLFYMRRLNRKTIQFDAPNDIFTKGELEVIFWAQQRLSSKEIAKRLNLSPRTVENRLQFIYGKAGVHSIIQLVEYCKHTGLDSYIPSDFVRKGVQLIE